MVFPRLDAVIRLNLRLAVAVHFIFKFLTNLEKRKFLWSDLDDLAGFWVPAHISLVVFDDKTSKAAYLYAATRCQGVSHGVEDDIDDFFRFFIGKAIACGECFNQF